jgi:hypothetical protein
MMKRRNILFLISAACCLGCAEDTITAPDNRWLATSEIERLVVFARDWPGEYVEVDLKRDAGKSTLVIFRPPQPGVPRVLIDSIGPNEEDPAEIVELMKRFNVWAMSDSNAVGAACSTKTGQWVCNPTSNDYSVVIYVVRGGEARSQRYTRLRESGSNATARALGDYAIAMARKRIVSARSH